MSGPIGTPKMASTVSSVITTSTTSTTLRSSEPSVAIRCFCRCEASPPARVRICLAREPSSASGSRVFCLAVSTRTDRLITKTSTRQHQRDQHHDPRHQELLPEIFHGPSLPEVLQWC